MVDAIRFAGDSLRHLLCSFARRLRGDEGNALIEFPFLGVLLLIPLAYVILAALTVQKAAFAVTAATREAGRAYVTTTTGDPAARAEAAARLAMRDQGLDLPAGALRIDCDGECGSPGTTVRVGLDYVAALPFVPRILGTPSAGVAVHARHAQVVDTYREPLP